MKGSNKDIKKILLFSYGNSHNASAWSNIPYLMRESLEKAGIKVISHNLLPNRVLKHLILKTFRCDKFYDYVKPGIVRKYNHNQIKKIVNLHSDADFCLFLNYDYYNKFNKVPTLLFHDWNYSMFLERHHHIPNKREQKFLDYQNDVIRNADIVATLFSDAQSYMQAQYPNKNIVKIDRNLVNLLDKSPLDVDEVIRKKYNSDYILFMGRDHYREGLDRLTDALSVLNRQLKLKVIGMTGKNTRQVEYYGWLKKDIEEQNKLYYSLLRGAKICINTTPGWAGYSSIIEAMYYATPIIIYPFNQFLDEFGRKLSFGFYSKGELEDLSQKISIISGMSYREYYEMAKNSHDTVKDYTWDNYIADLLGIMSKFKINPQLTI